MNKTELKAKFANGCVPDGNDFSELIDRTFSANELKDFVNPLLNEVLRTAETYSDSRIGAQFEIELTPGAEKEVTHELKRFVIAELFKIENETFKKVDFSYRLLNIDTLVVSIDGRLNEGRYLLLLR